MWRIFFQHLFDKEGDQENKTNLLVGSIHGKIENFLQNSDPSNQKKKFEDSVLTGVSDIMSKVKNKLETPTEEDKGKLCFLSVICNGHCAVW